ncbi:hypothetical protein HBN50_14985 [Halobacteriovorax sp. GB3]|uniref:hypothetical protein n=1 Tax=Halobacteriovorax sp. GB3 TaxID=2719615 RepID=UPI00236279E7|nr:hypothetical protein [Halobacteriovorax sp. GB3]MDD0854415.1 hypothetical protein [Halobacteriovorax sp. GB3]
MLKIARATTLFVLTFLLNETHALPTYCKKVDGDIQSKISSCLERKEESSANDLMEFAQKFSDYNVEGYSKSLEKKMAQRALSVLSSLYAKKLESFPTEKPVGLDREVKSCLAKFGVSYPTPKNGKLSDKEETKRQEAVKSLMNASVFAESVFEEIEELKSKKDSIYLPRNVRSQQEAEKLREAYDKKRDLEKQIYGLNRELIALSNQFPQLFERGKNLFQYPTGEMKRSKLQLNLEKHFSDKIGDSKHSYNQSLFRHDLHRSTDGRNVANYINSYLKENEKKITNEDDLKKLAFNYEAKEAQALKDINNSMKELCDGNIDQLHNHPALMTSLYQESINNGDQALFQMAHCKMIDENPENPDANWGLLLAGGGLIAMSFIPGGVFVAATIAGGIGFGVYGAHETYKSYHDLLLDKGLAHSQIIDQEKLTEREKTLVLNSYFSLLDAVSPGFSRLAKAKPMVSAQSSEVQLMKRRESINHDYINEGEEYFYENDPFSIAWKGLGKKSPRPSDTAELINAFGYEKFYQLKKEALSLHGDSLIEYELFLKEMDVPYTVAFDKEDKRPFIELSFEQLEEAGIPSAKIIKFLSQNNDATGNLKRYYASVENGVDEDLTQNGARVLDYKDPSELKIIFDPYRLNFLTAHGINDPTKGLYLKMSDIGPLLNEGKIAGTTRHEFQHRYFQRERSFENYESPYHSEFKAENGASLGKTGYKRYQSSEELYNFANQGFWDMRENFKKLSRFDEPIEKGLNDLNPKLPNFEKEARAMDVAIDDAIFMAEQTKTNAAKVVNVVAVAKKSKDTRLDFDYRTGSAAISFADDLKYYRYVNPKDIYEYRRLLKEHGEKFHPGLPLEKNLFDQTKYNKDKHYRASVDVIMEKKKMFYDDIQQSAQGLVDRSNRIIDEQDELIVAVDDFKKLTKGHYQKLKEGYDLSSTEAKEIEESYRELYLKMRRIGVAAQ